MARNPKITHKKGKDGRLVYVDGKLFVDRDADLDDNSITVGPLHPIFFPLIHMCNTYSKTPKTWKSLSRF